MKEVGEFLAQLEVILCLVAILPGTVEYAYKKSASIGIVHNAGGVHASEESSPAPSVCHMVRPGSVSTPRQACHVYNLS
jgi:hypothetical protein